MRSRYLATVLLSGCLLAAALAADPPKKTDGGTLPPGDYTGKLVSTPGTDGSFTVTVETDRTEANANAASRENHEVQQLLKDQEHIDKLQIELARAKTVKEYEHRLAQLNDAVARMQANGVRDQLKNSGAIKVVKEHKDVDFHAADGVKVRTQNPPPRFDDKGNLKPYTKDELAGLKGKDKDLPGYEAASDALKAGQQVKVTLALPKTTDKKDSDKDKDSDAQPKKGNEVTVILILADDAGDKGKK
jgi:hypothetical protein